MLDQNKMSNNLPILIVQPNLGERVREHPHCSSSSRRTQFPPPVQLQPLRCMLPPPPTLQQLALPILSVHPNLGERVRKQPHCSSSSSSSTPLPPPLKMQNTPPSRLQRSIQGRLSPPYKRSSLCRCRWAHPPPPPW